VVHDYAAMSLSLKAHPVSFVRGKLQQLHIVATGHLATMNNGDAVKVAGLVLVKQRPERLPAFALLQLKMKQVLLICGLSKSI
jgi:hypothetical protein